MEIEMNSTPTIKNLGQLKQKALAPIGQAERIYMNTKVNSPQPNSMLSPHHEEQSHLWEWINCAMLRDQQNPYKDPE